MTKEQFINLYKSNPCRYHASALWKTLAKEDVIYDSIEDKEGIKTIKIYNDTTLFLYWDIDNNVLKDTDDYKLILFHVKQLEGENEIKESADSYFRLKHNGNRANKNNNNYHIKEVDITNETQLISDFIGKCYQDLRPSKDEVLSWTKHPVFNSNLWIWVADQNTGEYLGLGIAEYDKEIKEGSLEWIQVLSEHSGKGVGKVMVNELVNRMYYADCITVSGRADNAAAEKLYRSCGFVGDDVWYVIKK